MDVCCVSNPGVNIRYAALRPAVKQKVLTGLRKLSPRGQELLTLVFVVDAALLALAVGRGWLVSVLGRLIDLFSATGGR
ncbi:unnamed protein product [Linum trigynum]|uniref:Uncharacterized protein n=1 Tax=Linum trigynum TaxID=586398 RepID=A0AAV2DCV7_9ROSI